MKQIENRLKNQSKTAWKGDSKKTFRRSCSGTDFGTEINQKSTKIDPRSLQVDPKWAQVDPSCPKDSPRPPQDAPRTL